MTPHTAPRDAPEVSNRAFLDALCPSFKAGYETFWACTFAEDPSDKRAPWGGGPVGHKIGPLWRTKVNSYFSIATIKPGEGAGRRINCFSRMFAVFLDDVVGQLPLAPTYVIQTSPAKRQAGYRLAEPISDLETADRLMQALVRAGLVEAVDKGGVNVVRYGRLPVGCNTKASHVEANGGQPFAHRLLEWSPELAYTPEDLAAAFRLDLTPRPRAKVEPRPGGDLRSALLFGLIHAAGLHKRAADNGLHEITCPWVDEHTGALDSGTAYFDPSAEYPEGGFVCQHGHCADRHLGELRRKLGPEVYWRDEGEEDSRRDTTNGTHAQPRQREPGDDDGETEPTQQADTGATRAREADPLDGLSIGAALDREEAKLEIPIPRIATGWPRLDKVLGGGLEVPSLTVLGAGPKSGKSTWAQIVAVRHVEAGGYAYVLDLENGSRRFLRRVLCRRSRLGSSQVVRALTNERAGIFTTQDQVQDWQAAKAWVKAELRPRLFVEHRAPGDFVERIKAVVARANGRKVLVVLDSLQKLPGDPRDDRRTVIDKWVRMLEGLRYSLEAAFLAVSEIKRGKEGYAAREDAFKESGGIEYGADLAITLNRAAADEEDESGVSTLRVELARDAEEDPRGDVASFRPVRPYYDLEEVEAVPLAKRRAGRPASKKGAAVAFLAGVLSEGAITIDRLTTLAEAAGHSERTIKRARAELKTVPCTVDLKAGVRLP